MSPCGVTGRESLLQQSKMPWRESRWLLGACDSNITHGQPLRAVLVRRTVSRPRRGQAISRQIATDAEYPPSTLALQCRVTWKRLEIVKKLDYDGPN